MFLYNKSIFINNLIIIYNDIYRVVSLTKTGAKGRDLKTKMIGKTYILLIILSYSY